MSGFALNFSPGSTIAATLAAWRFGKDLVEALGLPKCTKALTLRARVGEVVTVECEYMPETGDVVPALAE